MHCPRVAARLPRHGFTTIELLCTIAIAAITLAVGIPNLHRGVMAHALSARLEAFTSALRFARSEALKRGETVTVCVAAVPVSAAPTCAAEPEWHDGWLVFLDHGELGAFGDGDRLLAVQTDDRPGIRIESTRRAISFRASGVAVSGTGSYRFSPSQRGADAALIRTVCVNKQGRARVVSGACA